MSISPVHLAPLTPSLPPSPPVPKAIEPGTADYYKQRLEDFKARNPGVEPPDYYLGYGQKYMERFQSLDASDLSAEGLQWRDKTTLALQQAIEQKRAEDPEAFAELERNPEKFREFAFASHPGAYVDCGLFDLPAHDLMVIAATPDVKDVLSSEGIKQTLITTGKLTPGDFLSIGKETVERYIEDVGPLIASLPGLGGLPPGVSIDMGIQGERMIDRFRDHSSSDIFQLPGFLR